ncbi:hypothetical protein WA158_007579 [Blastocystis sp. Blastoise]
MIADAHVTTISKAYCDAEEYEGKHWPQTKLGKSAFSNCVGLGFYRRICIFQEEPNGSFAAIWGDVESKCRCPEENEWRETDAHDVDQIDCPPGYSGHILRECRDDGTWDKIIDRCIYMNDEL